VVPEWNPVARNYMLSEKQLSQTVITVRCKLDNVRQLGVIGILLLTDIVKVSDGRDVGREE